MKAIQKVIIFVYCVLVAVACIYVPYEIKVYGYPTVLRYSPIWKPALFSPYEGVTSQRPLATIDYHRVILELIAITAVFAIFFVLILRPKQKKE